MLGVALRQRLKGCRPAGNWNLGRYGFAVNVLALCYGIFAMVLLLKPGDTGSFLDKWVVAIGLAIVLVTGLLYLLIARPDQHSDDVGEGDAIEVAAKLRSLRAGSSTE